jgi:hypothetical protein
MCLPFLGNHMGLPLPLPNHFVKAQHRVRTRKQEVDYIPQSPRFAALLRSSSPFLSSSLPHPSAK